MLVVPSAVSPILFHNARYACLLQLYAQETKCTRGEKVVAAKNLANSIEDSRQTYNN